METYPLLPLNYFEEETERSLREIEVKAPGIATRRCSSARSLPCSTASGSTTPGAAQPFSSTAIGLSTYARRSPTAAIFCASIGSLLSPAKRCAGQPDA